MAPLIPALISIVPSLLEIFGTKKQAEVAEKVMDIAKAVTGEKDPEIAVKALARSPELALVFEKAVMDNRLEFKKLDIEEQKIYTTDTQDARKYRDEKTFWLGISVLGTFLSAVLMVLFGAYYIIIGELVVDPAIFAALTGTIGTLVGYTAANAQAVINYFFGSSHGSMLKSYELADSVKNFKR